MRGDTTLLRLIAPIAADLDNPQVTDVVVNKPHEVMIREAGIWRTVHVPSFDFETLDAATILIGQRVGREFDEASPYVNSTLPGGQRFQGVRPPGTKSDRVLWAIRRPPSRARRLDDDDFDGLFTQTNNGATRRQRVRENLLDAYNAREWRKLFTAARLSGLSIAFCGPTGSGKSDLARRCLGVNRPSSRMVTIETDDEFGDVGPENKAIIFYDDTQVTSDEAVRIALRLVPVEIALQEVRGAEAYSLLRAMNSGHSGVTTWHAMEGSELDALCMLARQHPAGREMTEDRLMAMARDAFDVIAYCYRDGNEFRVSSVRLMAMEREAAL
jgi:type IV secretion system protein VirB11